MGQGASKIPKEQLNFLLMGKTGHGKSTLGNCVLGCRFFEVSSDTTSHTQEVKCGYSDFQKYSLKVVDGPGLVDTQLDKITDKERAIKNINKALLLCCEGLDAVIFVFKFGVRLTEEEVSAIETFKNTFGERYLNHVIFVLVGCREFNDYMKEENFKGKFDDWCLKQTGAFKELYEAHQNRFIFFNSFEQDKKKQITQREQLTALAHAIKSCHGRYTAECFRLAAVERARLIIELNAPILNENIQREAGILYSKIQEYIQTTNEESLREVKLAIQTLKDEITKEDKGKDLLADLTKVVSDIERSLNDKDKLLDHAKELEQTRTAKRHWIIVVDMVTVKNVFANLGSKVTGFLKK